MTRKLEVPRFLPAVPEREFEVSVPKDRYPFYSFREHVIIHFAQSDDFGRHASQLVGRYPARGAGQGVPASRMLFRRAYPDIVLELSRRLAYLACVDERLAAAPASDDAREAGEVLTYVAYHHESELALGSDHLLCSFERGAVDYRLVMLFYDVHWKSARVSCRMQATPGEYAFCITSTPV